MLPNFLIIGAMKGGTTSLYEYLRGHPQVFMPDEKELRFFDGDTWDRGLAWYEGQFAGGAAALAVGEASVGYTMHPHGPDAAARIAEHLPDARLIYVVRHPVDRIRSHYLFNVSLGVERRPIERAVREEPLYVDTSRYATQIDRYLRFFPRERLLVIPSDRLRRDRAGVLRRAYAFLGLDPNWVPGNLEREYLQTAERRIRRPAVDAMRRLGAYRTVARIVPSALKARVWRLVEPAATTRVDHRAGALGEGIRSELEDVLREDVRRLRAYLDDGFDGWGIA